MAGNSILSKVFKLYCHHGDVVTVGEDRDLLGLVEITVQNVPDTRISFHVNDIPLLVAALQEMEAEMRKKA